MTVKNLGKTPFDAIVDCFLVAFEHYFVPMPTDKNYYKQRWAAAKVDFNLSYGMFEQDKLVGFVIHAVDVRNGILTAFNTGTGVLPEYRGRKIVQTIYDHALPDLQKNGVINCALEVITKNKIAIRAYERIGFKICKTYKCFKGTIDLKGEGSVKVEEVAFDNINWKNLPNQAFYSWDNQKEPIRKEDYKFFKVLKGIIPVSYFIINISNGYIAQFDLLDKTSNGWDNLFLGVKQISNTIKINNVDERLTDKIDALNRIGLVNSVDQYKMTLKISDNL